MKCGCDFLFGDLGSLVQSKALTELILTTAVNFGEIRRARLDKSTPPNSTLGPMEYFQIF